MDIKPKPSTQDKEEEKLSYEEQLQIMREVNKKTMEMSKKYDNFFRVSTLVFIVAAITIFLYKIPAFRQLISSKGVYVIQLQTFWWTIPGFFFSFIGRKIFHYSASSFFQTRLHPKISAYPEVHQKQRLLIIIKLTYEALYHLITSVVCFYLFFQQEWFPSCLGGFGRCDLILQSWPAWPQNKEGLIAFYNFQLGTYIFLTLDLVVFDYERFKTKNFGQLFFHHFITILLIIFSISYNFVGIGVLIFFIHEISDFFRGISHIVGDSSACIQYPNLANVINYFSLVVWIYTRIMVFPFCIINEMYEGFQKCIIQVSYSYLPQGIFLIVLSIAIYAMQCYWVVLIYKSVQKEKAKNQPYVEEYLKSKQIQEKSKKN